MNSRSAMNQVKTKVRREALFLRVFTAADVIRATGLNPDSVRTELQRMKREGLLTSERTGSREARYHISNDPEKRLELSQSLHAFYPPIPPADSPSNPSSEHYQQAQQRLDTAMSTSEDDCLLLLAEAKELLELAAREEGYVSASEAVLSYLGYERARLAYLLGKHEAAERSFQALRPFFESVGDTTRVQDIDEFHVIFEALEADNVCFTTAGPAQRLRECLQAHRLRGPLLPRLVNMLDHAPNLRGNKAASPSLDINAGIRYFSGAPSPDSPQTAALAA